VILPRLAAHVPANDGRMETFSVWGSYINVSGCNGTPRTIGDGGRHSQCVMAVLVTRKSNVSDLRSRLIMRKSGTPDLRCHPRCSGRDAWRGWPAQGRPWRLV